MHIEEVTIEGFKSYAKRVVVTQFDSSFNAITGLNGSGKSNILDAICFVLGIKNLSHVRANNVVELVYKQGQAGVTKATVSIKFDNSDPIQSPVGYADKQKIIVTRQVVVGGREKFMINAKQVQQAKIQDLFQSVSLNVNNPHFFIMQGRITKVLNMKPPEILGMVEEAANTRMCDQKCSAARKTLSKKEGKRAQIDEMLEHDLRPGYERLAREKEQYLDWQKACSSVEQLGHIVSAHRCWEVMRAIAREDETIQAHEEALQGFDADQESFEKDIKAKEEELERLREAEGGAAAARLQAVKREADKLGLALAKHAGIVDGKRDDAQTLAQEMEKLKADLGAVSEEALAARAAEAAAAQAASREVLAKAAAALEAAKCELAGMESGDGRDESNRSLPERLRDTEAEAVQQSEAIKAAGVTVAHLRAQMEAAQAAAAQKRGDDAALQAELAARQHALQAAQRHHDGIHVDAAQTAALEGAVREERAAVERCRARCQELAGGVGHVLNVNYRSPGQHFDAAAVKGVLARLVRVKEARHALALEVAAGAKLYHLVVTTDRVGAELIEKNCLQKRVTIVPLNKTRAAVASAQKQGRATAHTHGRAALALELVDADAEVAVAMQYAFGNVFICEDRNAARRVVDAGDVACRAVTLQGDDYAPAGTITGGSRGRGEQLLVRIAAYATAEAELRRHQEALAAAEAALAQLPRQEKAAAAERVEQERHLLQLVQQRAQHSAGHKAAAHAAALEEQLAAAAAHEGEARAAQQALLDKAAELKRTIRDFDTNRGGIIKAAKARVAAAAKAHDAAKQAAAAAGAEAQERAADEAGAADERAELTQQLAGAEASLATATAEVAEAEAERQELQRRFDAAEAAAAEAKAEAEQRGASARAALAERNELVAQSKENSVERKKAVANLRASEGRLKDLQDNLAALEERDTWLPRVRDQLGVEGGKYDFAALDMAAKRAAYAAAHEAMTARGAGVNKSVVQDFERAERRIGDLEAKAEALVRDKASILKTLEELDVQKERQVRTAWERINESFGDIFALLLPGTTAKLQPPDGADLAAGLEVKVAFAGVWKKSLTELSGGQRSLVALALVFALLAFRPAPLYILDEVDAALDLSHTANIGHMIRQHFNDSQFIVVSLKDGMFNNANVIFRTRFVDGSSTVVRTLGSGAAGGGAGRGGSGAPAAKRGRTDAPQGEENEQRA